MSRLDYKKAIDLVTTIDAHITFEALVMAAIHKGGSGYQQAMLKKAFPDIYAEFHYRYWCSGGIMPGEPGYIKELDDNLPVKP